MIWARFEDLELCSYSFNPCLSVRRLRLAESMLRTKYERKCTNKMVKKKREKNQTVAMDPLKLRLQSMHGYKI